MAGARLLRGWMDREGVSQVALASLLSVSQAHVSDLAGGRKRPSLALAALIEGATRGAVPALSWLRDEDEDESEGAAA